ncbi:MAG: ABC transporter ATP-binding protein [Lachnospiraceae bacterium]|nr:ABC transporter ATP-binding protein [Lachnospiraceae bacterium]
MEIVMEECLVLKNIMKRYESGKGKNRNMTEALKGVSLSIAQGEFVAVTGRSGCGKSTLLNIMGGMDRQTSGEYLFRGEKIDDMNARALARFRNQSIGFVFQAFYLAKELTAADNVAMPLGYAHVRSRERKQRAEEALTAVGLGTKFHARPSQLSGGEQQRVAIARAIINHPAVLLADEPTGNLDCENGQKIMNLLHRLHDDGLTIVMVTHDLALAEQADRIIYMEDGRQKNISHKS